MSLCVEVNLKSNDNAPIDIEVVEITNPTFIIITSFVVYGDVVVSMLRISFNKEYVLNPNKNNMLATTKSFLSSFSLLCHR